MQRSLRYGLAAASGAVLIAGAAFVGDAWAAYATWGTLGPGPPPRIEWCGRRYYPSSTSLTGAQVTSDTAKAAYPAQLREIARSPAGYAVLAAPMSPVDQARFRTQVCAMVVYLRLGPDSYRPYGLSGGP